MSSEQKTIRFSVPHGISVPEILFRDGSYWKVVSGRMRTVGQILEAPFPLLSTDYPFANFVLVDEHVMSVRPLRPEEWKDGKECL